MTTAAQASSRAPLSEALAWIDAHAAQLGMETLDAATGLGRVLATAVISSGDWPAADCAAIDGYAVRASDTEGAGDYSPIPLIAAPIAPGMALPPGTDAVLPLAAARAISLCKLFGVQMSITSMSGRAISLCQSVSNDS